MSASGLAAGTHKTGPGIWLKTIAYSLPLIGMALLNIPTAAILSAIYAKHYGLSLAAIATVMLVARMFDAVTDPLIGYYSDRRRVKTGRPRFF